MAEEDAENVVILLMEEIPAPPGMYRIL